MTPGAFLQAQLQQLCEPFTATKLRRLPCHVCHSLCVLHQVHSDLCELWHGCHFSTAIDEATRCACVSVLSSKESTAADLRRQIA